MHFRLSNRQRKELYVRGRSLLIAVPLAGENYVAARRDPLAVARRLLPDVDETIQSAELGAVEYLVPCSVRPAPESLTAAIGPIRKTADGGLGLRAEVLLVWLSHGEPRQTTAAWQWPQSVVIDGQQWPARIETDAEGV
jgi:hypothetical protein